MRWAWHWPLACQWCCNRLASIADTARLTPPDSASGSVFDRAS